MKSFTVFGYLGHIKLTMQEYRRYSNRRNSNNFINENLATNATSLQSSGEILTVRCGFQVDEIFLSSILSIRT